MVIANGHGFWEGKFCGNLKYWHLHNNFSEVKNKKMLGMYWKPGLKMALLLLNNGTMSQMPDAYSALGNLQSAFPSLDPSKQAYTEQHGCCFLYEPRGG